MAIKPPKLPKARPKPKKVSFAPSSRGPKSKPPGYIKRGK